MAYFRNDRHFVDFKDFKFYMICLSPFLSFETPGFPVAEGTSSICRARSGEALKGSETSNTLVIHLSHNMIYKACKYSMASRNIHESFPWFLNPAHHRTPTWEHAWHGNLLKACKAKVWWLYCRSVERKVTKKPVAGIPLKLGMAESGWINNIMIWNQSKFLGLSYNRQSCHESVYCIYQALWGDIHRWIKHDEAIFFHHERFFDPADMFFWCFWVCPHIVEHFGHVESVEACAESIMGNIRVGGFYYKTF